MPKTQRISPTGRRVPYVKDLSCRRKSPTDSLSQQRCIPKGYSVCSSLADLNCVCKNGDFTLALADCEQSTCLLSEIYGKFSTSRLTAPSRKTLPTRIPNVYLLPRNHQAHQPTLRPCRRSRPCGIRRRFDILRHLHRETTVHACHRRANTCP